MRTPGCLTYGGTTEKDALCVAYLLRAGADLSIINTFMHPKLNTEQSALLQDLLKDMHKFELNGTQILIARASRSEFIDGLASLTRKLTEIESVDAAFTVVKMRDRVHVVARSDAGCVDVRKIVHEFGGGGHPGAGSAVAREGTVQQIAERIETMLRAEVPPEKLAEQIMTSPVRTILPTVSMDEANRIMIRHALDGLLIAQDQAVIGVISRRDVDQAVHHKLSHAPVSGFMSKPVISISPDTKLSTIQHLMVAEDIGRLPVIDKTGKLIGVVSREDLRRSLYGPAAGKSWSSEPINFPITHPVGNFETELARLPESTLWLSKAVGDSAAALGMVAYAIGGFVRDLILSTPNFDLDYVVEGNAIELAKYMADRFKDELKVVAEHERFQTATLEYHRDGKRYVDFSTARTEFYEYPAALPTPEPSNLEQDLMRRDFTINALAICLNPNRYGELIDTFGGLEDLRHRTIRVLHPFSFIEDPTRIIRAVRFAARLNFELSPETREQAKYAISVGIFDDLGGTRIRKELKLILESPRRLKALELLSELGAKLRYLDSELQYSTRLAKVIRRAERLLERHELQNPWLVYLGLLLSELEESKVSAVLDRLHSTNEHKEVIQSGLAVRRDMPHVFDQIQTSKTRHSEIYHLLHGKSREALAIAVSLAEPGSPLRRMTKLYLEKLQLTSIELSGSDLIDMGFKPGPLIGRVLNLLLDAKLNGEIKTKEDELNFVRQHYSDKK